MSLMKRWFAIVAMSCGLAPAAAAAADATAVVEAVESKYATVTSMSADFVQTTRSDVFGEEIQQGELVLKRPAMMRWQFTGANEKQFVTNGSTMWIYTRAENQVIRYDDVTQSSAADSILQSLDTLDEQYKVDLVEGAADKHVLELRPLEESEGQFKLLRLVLTTDYVVERVEITDPFDSRTDLVFRNVRLDAEVPDSAFQFVVPEGVEVISTGAM